MSLSTSFISLSPRLRGGEGSPEGEGGRLAFLLLLLAGLTAHPVLASTVGTTGANLLKAEVGPRTQAMGGAGTALTGDLAGLLTNPALLVPIGGRALMLTHWPGVAEMRTEYASYAIPVGGLGFWAGSVLFRTLPDVDNDVPGEAPVAVNDGMLMMTFGRPVGKGRGAAGLNIKLFNSTLGDSRATSVALDMGAVTATSGANPLRYGISVDNVGNPIKHESTGEALPLTVNGGVSWGRAWYPNSLTLAADGSFNVEQNLRVAAGAEWVQAGRVSLRVGGGYGRFTGANFGLGAGWQFRSTLLGPEAEYHLDYAFLPFALLSQYVPTNAFSLYIKF